VLVVGSMKPPGNDPGSLVGKDVPAGGGVTTTGPALAPGSVGSTTGAGAAPAGASAVGISSGGDSVTGAVSITVGVVGTDGAATWYRVLRQLLANHADKSPRLVPPTETERLVNALVAAGPPCPARSSPDVISEEHAAATNATTTLIPLNTTVGFMRSQR
jgi:hypothetical protein